MCIPREEKMESVKIFDTLANCRSSSFDVALLVVIVEKVAILPRANRVVIVFAHQSARL
jgi:hypothetical protein